MITFLSAIPSGPAPSICLDEKSILVIFRGLILLRSWNFLDSWSYPDREGSNHLHLMSQPVGCCPRVRRQGDHHPSLPRTDGFSVEGWKGPPPPGVSQAWVNGDSWSPGPQLLCPALDSVTCLGDTLDVPPNCTRRTLSFWENPGTHYQYSGF